jgi:hypothetical protein
MLVGVVAWSGHAAAASYFDFPMGTAYADARGHADSSSVRSAFHWTQSQLDRRADGIVFTYTEHTEWQSHCSRADGSAFTVAHVTDLKAPLRDTLVRSHHKVVDFQLRGVATKPPVMSTLDQIDAVPNGGCPSGTTSTSTSGSTDAAILATFARTTVQVH